jgi:hypothetical protein
VKISGLGMLKLVFEFFFFIKYNSFSKFHLPVFLYPKIQVIIPHNLYDATSCLLQKNKKTFIFADCEHFYRHLQSIVPNFVLSNLHLQLIFGTDNKVNLLHHLMLIND